MQTHFIPKARSYYGFMCRTRIDRRYKKLQTFFSRTIPVEFDMLLSYRHHTIDAFSRLLSSTSHLTPSHLQADPVALRIRATAAIPGWERQAPSRPRAGSPWHLMHTPTHGATLATDIPKIVKTNLPSPTHV